MYNGDKFINNAQVAIPIRYRFMSYIFLYKIILQDAKIFKIKIINYDSCIIYFYFLEPFLLRRLQDNYILNSCLFRSEGNVIINFMDQTQITYLMVVLRR